MNKTVTIILILVIIALVGCAYYLYSGVTKCKDVAADLGTRLQQCGAGVTTCQGALDALKQIPACAAYIPAQ